ncbi:MAG: MarR family winged helix-turn-helix transcriptional regulator [Coriobacteriia bacterium]|nr:MarR family winged helix-turn-helix transcriptional regulator [Coriobacteriia bacterium]
MIEQEPTNPRCPGCHFRCDLLDPECGRGVRLSKDWEETGELPLSKRERMKAAEKEGKPRPPRPDRFGDRRERLPFLFDMAANCFKSKREGDEVLKALQKHEGYASLHVIAGRAREDEHTARRILEHLEWYGLVALSYDHPQHLFAYLTPAGHDEVERIADERTQQVQDAFADFTDEELTQLEALLKKTLDASRPKH